MDLSLDLHDLRNRIGTITMEEAGIGGTDDPDELAVQYFDADGGPDPTDADQLDDVLRLAVTVLAPDPFDKLSYLWAGIGPDEPLDLIVLRGRQATSPDRGTSQSWVEVPVGLLGRAPAGDTAKAVEHVALEIVRAFDPPTS